MSFATGDGQHKDCQDFENKVETIKYTTCGEHCWNSCVLKIRVKGNRIVAAEPDDTINPGIAREDGRLPEEEIDQCMIQARPCAKGYVKAALVHDENRVLYPLKRAGERGEAKFTRISWEEALDTIAGKLVETKQKYGPYSILGTGYGGGGGFPLAPWFGAGVGVWGSHSTQGVAEPEQWVTGKPQTRQERQDEGNLLKAKLIVLWGWNPTTTLSNSAVYTFLRARERGIPIISIEQRYTPTAETLADQRIPIRPTTDVPNKIAISNVWFKEDLCDREAIDRWVEPVGLRRWQDYVLGNEDGTEKTPEWAEKICGVPAETITGFARLYARSKPVNLNTSYSLGRQFWGENAIRAAIYLQALTGNVCTPGGTASAESGSEFGFRRGNNLPLPAVNWQRGPGIYKAPVMMVHYRWPLAVELRDKLDKGVISLSDYNRAVGNAPEAEPPNIRMAILEMDDSLMTHPDINANIRAYKKLDFIVVFSHHTDNPNARYADIVLPQMSNAHESRDGGNLFHAGWNMNGNYFVYRQKCIDPPGEIRPWGWVWTQIARRLGIAGQYNPLLADVPDEKWDETMENLHRLAYEEWALKAEVARLNPPAWDEFMQKPVFRWRVTDPYYPYKKIVESGDNPFKATESQKIEFYSRKLARGPEFLADHEFEAGSGKWYGGGRLPPVAKMVMGGKANYHSEDIKNFPLLLSSPHPLFRVHSFLDNQPLLSVDCYRHAAWISVADAKKRGIRDNDRVLVFNDLGQMVLPAYVTSRVIPGVVIVFHGAWYTPGKKTDLMPEGIDTRGAPNLVTHYDEHLPETIIDHLPCKGLVEVKKWEGD